MPTARFVRNGGDLVQDIIVELWRAYPRFQPARALALHFSGADNCRSRTSRAVAANRSSKATGPAQSTAGAEQNRAVARQTGADQPDRLAGRLAGPPAGVGESLLRD